jgi:hypothetical protein
LSPFQGIGEGSEMGTMKPVGAPAWLPAKIWKPNVKKVGGENLERLNLWHIFNF